MQAVESWTLDNHKQEKLRTRGPQKKKKRSMIIGKVFIIAILTMIGYILVILQISPYNMDILHMALLPTKSTTCYYTVQ